MDFAHLELADIRPNTANPRGIQIQTEDSKLDYLKDSIRQFGVLVPIVVSRDNGAYLLIDGERRYWACRSLGIQKIPAYILKPGTNLSDTDLLLRMFQIHHNREQWGAVQQCQALESVYNKIIKERAVVREKDEKVRLKLIAEKLGAQTGIEERTALNRIYFLRWPTAIKQRLYNKPGEEGYWYICEIEEKIVIPAIINYPEYFARVPVHDVRTDLFTKLEKHSVSKSTEVRRVAPFFRTRMPSEKERKDFVGVLKRLHRDSEMTYAEAEDELQKKFPHFMRRDPVSSRKLQSVMRQLQTAIDDFDLTTLDSARKKAKATREELLRGVENLAASLDHFQDQLKQGRLS